MAAIREVVDIEAPSQRVWAVVHEDIENAPRWSAGLARIELLSESPDRKGSRLRYHIDTPGGAQQLDVELTAVVPGRSCSGRFVGGPLKGEWKYQYVEREGSTRLTYSMDYEPNGWTMKLFFGLVERQLPGDIKRTMAQLKRYVESGKGPRPDVAPAPLRARRKPRAGSPEGTGR